MGSIAMAIIAASLAVMPAGSRNAEKTQAFLFVLFALFSTAFAFVGK